MGLLGLLAEDVAVAVLVPGLHRRRLRLHPLVLVLLGGSVDAGRANLRSAHVEFGVFLGEPRGSVLVVDDVLVVVGGEGKRGATVDVESFAAAGQRGRGRVRVVAAVEHALHAVTLPVMDDGLPGLGKLAVLADVCEAHGEASKVATDALTRA